jgi:hypothetical protein
MCMFLAVEFFLELLAHNVGVDALVLDANKGPFLLYKSDHVRSFWVHLLYMVQ